MKRDVPVMVSLTVESTGTMLVGTDVAAALAALEPYPLFSLGLNCATGPEGMVSHIRHLLPQLPRAGLLHPERRHPEVSAGRRSIRSPPRRSPPRSRPSCGRRGCPSWAGAAARRPNTSGSCARRSRGPAPPPRTRAREPSLGSLYQAVEIRQEIPPFLIGERCNANGSKRFRELLLADDFDGAVRVALDQQRDGAHAVDLCAAYAGRDESADLAALARLFARSVHAPMVVDSTRPDCIEAALSALPGKVPRQLGEPRGRREEPRADLPRGDEIRRRRHRPHDRREGDGDDGRREGRRRRRGSTTSPWGGTACGRRTWSSTSSPSRSARATPRFRTRRRSTLAAMRRVKEELPGVLTSLGVSNISFGLSPASRKVLNSVFLHEAVAAGLDMAIIDAGKILPMSKIPEADREDLPRPHPQPPADRRRVAAVRLHPPFRGRSRSRRRGRARGRRAPPSRRRRSSPGRCWPATGRGWTTSWRSCCPAARRRRSSTRSWSPRCAAWASCSAGGRCSSPSCSGPRR